MDLIDKKILFQIQKNSTIPLSELSKRVGISSTPCWNRIRKLEEKGVIQSRITVLDNEKINLPITVFLSISVSHHSTEWVKSFSNLINKFDQITEVHRLTSSSTDYLLKIVSPSISSYDKFQQKLINEIEFTQMSSSISLKEMKNLRILPLEFI